MGLDGSCNPRYWRIFSVATDDEAWCPTPFQPLQPCAELVPVHRSQRAHMQVTVEVDIPSI
jgi:hypothetical protein